MYAYVLCRSCQASHSYPLILRSAARPRNQGQAGLDGAGKSGPSVLLGTVRLLNYMGPGLVPHSLSFGKSSAFTPDIECFGPYGVASSLSWSPLKFPPLSRCISHQTPEPRPSRRRICWHSSQQKWLLMRAGTEEAQVTSPEPLLFPQVGEALLPSGGWIYINQRIVNIIRATSY